MKELSPERWRAVREVFEAALVLADGEREAFLDRAADGDAELRDEVELLLAAHRRAGGFMASPSARLADPDPVEPPAPALLGRLGPYRLLGELGRGGMGHVYLAERADGAFSMRVAVKVLAAGFDGEEARRRFHGERQILADLDHPGIARLLDGGATADGRPYLVMELVDGEPIDRYCDRMRLPAQRRVDLVRRVAEAVDHAHRRGVVHRDLKPANVAVTADGEPKLLDFGIAKLLRDGGGTEAAITVAGSPPMTPEYASPEQLSGGEVDPRSDVFSLGMVLCELLSGRLPARSTTPKGLRRRLGGDLDAVVATALAPEPARRYPTAGGLAADLGRWLAGEPVRARRPGVVERTGRWARRNRALTAAIAACLAVALGLGGLAIAQHRESRRRAELAQHFGRRGQELVVSMRMTKLLPMHDVTPARRRIRASLAEIEAEASEMGRLAEGPAAYAVGLGHMALDQHAQALEPLERAWDSGLRTPEVAYALGQSLAIAYRSALLAAPGTGSPRKAEALGVAESRYRDRALEYLALSRPLPEPAESTWVTALIHFAENDYDAALVAARRAAEANPWLLEARLLEHAVLALQGWDREKGGDPVGALRLYRSAAAVLRELLRTAPSDPAARGAQCKWWIRPSEVASRLGQLDRELRDQALDSCAEAQEVDPDDASLLGHEGAIWWTWAEHQAAQGDDPAAAYDQAVRWTASAQRRRPDDARVLSNLGLFLWRRARWWSTRGKDPAGEYRRAAAALDRAAELEPGQVDTLNSLGSVHANLWAWETARGRDSEESYEAAIDSYRRGLAAEPDNPRLLTNLGVLAARRAYRELAEGRDPEPFVEPAVHSLERAVAQDPLAPVIRINLAAAYLARALDRSGRGQDPGEAVTAAVGHAERALAIDPTSQGAFRNLGSAWRVLAVHRAGQGLDPGEAVAKGRAAMDEAALLAQPDSGSHLELALVALAELRWALHTGADPLPSAHDALGHLDHAERLDASDGAIPGARAEICWYLARWRHSERGGAGSWLPGGLAAAERARSLDPGAVEALAYQGALLALAAEEEPVPDRRAALACRAVDALEPGLAAKPALRAELEPVLARARRLGDCQGPDRSDPGR